MSLKVLDNCFGCGVCRFSCPREAILQLDDWNYRYTINPLLCNDCGLCVTLCHIEALVPDPDFAVCHGRGCPMKSSRFAGWICSEGLDLCANCGAILWKAPTEKRFACPRCDMGMKAVCPKTRKVESSRAA